MTNHVFVHTPWRHIDSYLPFLIESRLQPEIAFKGPDLDAVTSKEFCSVAETLEKHGLANTLHAPFMDLNPGALDPLVREATARRFHQTLDAAAMLNSRLVVFHPGYDFWRYGGQNNLWIEQNLSFWPEFVSRAETMNCPIVLENIFEESPDNILSVLQHFHSSFFGACFDIGHWRLFSKQPILHWIKTLGSYLLHLHLHDNFGSLDDHLPVGEGTIDFHPLAKQLQTLPALPSMTLEAHDPDRILRSVRGTQSIFLLG